ncbi:MAG: L-threonylcarbamoyladenylate synthase [Patescibacteria group bacterium]
MKAQIIDLLKKGKVGVMPTDTIYGIVGSALNPDTVENIYLLRKRTPDKPMIILISSLSDLKKFDIDLTKAQTEILQKIWPNPVSVVLPCPYEKFAYLHRGKKSLAFRMPKDERLLEILKNTGPLVAPSANLGNKKPAKTLEEAKKYFGDKVSFCIDGGKLQAKPSTIVRLYKDGSKIVLRKGSFKV